MAENKEYNIVEEKTSINGNAGAIMKKAEDIEKNANGILGFTFYNKTKAQIADEYTIENFRNLDIRAAFAGLKKCSALDHLLSIQVRINAKKDITKINIHEIYQIEYSGGDDGKAFGVGVMEVKTMNGNIYIRFGGIKKTTNWKMKTICKVSGYALTGISLGAGVFMAANKWKSNRANEQFREAEAARKHQQFISITESTPNCFVQ
mmetsp:Transcript_35852/g.44263  ORF Transcript_35852/g.44263 Transcript_35852/m.44263 type:complete len:206 (+) Transcript_35852:81-698(+)